MEKRFVLFLVVAVASSAFGMVFRHKRQTVDDEDSLDERYGWENQNRRPWQNQNQNGGGQFPWQNQNQNGGGRFPWQNQNGGQAQNQNGGQFPLQNQNQNQVQTTSTTQSPNGNGGSSSNAQDCMRNCPVTPEYNPVCGTDNVTYTNPGRLGCAQACGLNVSLLRSSPCPVTTVAPTS